MKTLPCVLIANENPPKTYLTALDLVGLSYDCNFSPKNLDKYSALVLIGGGDIIPQFYGKNIDFSGENIIRDLKEFTLLDYFYTKKLPILAICRGLQVVNVYLGGTLKNVTNHQSKDKKDVYHKVIPTKNGFLKNFVFVNSNHHQAVDVICDKAKDVLFSCDGEIEGFCVDDFIFATQFHPERMRLNACIYVFGKFASAVLKGKI